MLVRALSLVHTAVSLVWFAVALLYPTRAVFFGAGRLVFTHVASGLALALVRVRHTWRYFSWAIAITDVLGLVGIALTLADLWAARALSAAAPVSGAAAVQQLARVIWVEQPALAVFVLVLLAATALVHLVTAGTFFVLLGSRRCRAQCHPRGGEEEDVDADADAPGDAEDADAAAVAPARGAALRVRARTLAADAGARRF